MSHQKKIVLIGAGNIGKGYLADLFSSHGYHLVFLTRRLAQAQSMRQEGKYLLYQILSDGGRKERFISGYEAYSTEAEGEQCVQALCDTDYASVHLYPKSYPDIAALLAKAVKRKMQNGQERPLDVLLCVNSIRPARVFRRLILEQLQTDAQREYFEKKIGLVETLTNGGGHLPDEQFLREHPNAVVASSGEDLPVDGAAFRGEIPDDVPLRTLDRFEERLIYKLWYGNMRHLSVALYAYHRGETLMCNAAASAYERECVEQAGQEALFAVMQEFGFTLEELVQGDGYAVNMDAYWEQLKKRKDRDSVARVAADPIRKLEKEERLIGPALACIRHGKLPYFIARSIALMYSFQNPEDAQAVELQSYVSEHGLGAAMERFSGLCQQVPEEKLLRQLVEGHYQELMAGGGQSA